MRGPKLTDDERAQIIHMIRFSELSMHEIAIEYNITRGSVNYIKRKHEIARVGPKKDGLKYDGSLPVFRCPWCGTLREKKTFSCVQYWICSEPGCYRFEKIGFDFRNKVKNVKRARQLAR